MSTQNDPLNTTRLTRITNKYSFYFRFVKYLLYPTYILNLKRKVSDYKKLVRDIIGNWNFTNPRTTNTCFFFRGGIELAQMKLDELVENVMNLDINKESMDDNRGHS